MNLFSQQASSFQKRGPLAPPHYLKPLLLFLSTLYRMVIRWRNILFDRKIFKIKALPCPVISIGNLSVGGTGKTPLIITLAEKLKDDRDVVILSRGYGRKKKGKIVQMTDAGLALSSAVLDHLGDEPTLMGLKIPGITLGIGPHRYESGVDALQGLQRPVVLLDDGYQHRQLHRTINFLVIDASSALLEENLLPAGTLREPLTQIKRADAVIITRTASHPEDTKRLTEYLTRNFRDKPIFEANPVPEAIHQLDRWQKKSIQSLQAMSLLAFSAIGNPRSFETSLQRCKLQIMTHHIFRDHHRYVARDLRALVEMARRQRCQGLITTEKDGIKLTSLFQSLNLSLPCYMLAIKMDILDSPHFFSWLEERLTV
ncbi:tetraacyldisaccharide 4'-kinase [candidate division CSSED10-310 bacterium]|uniref:Tetraacyldisaccharide 4'-kinase n=1 Tax=candidate division CSSED10-310 bacterium TaxID=2855610 RepID=A0ABV6YX21_UNCC1